MEEYFILQIAYLTLAIFGFLIHQLKFMED